MMVGAKHSELLMQKLKQIPHDQNVINLKAKGEELQREVNRLK